MEPLVVRSTLSFNLVDPQKVLSKMKNLATFGSLRGFFRIFMGFNAICGKIRISRLSHSREFGYFL